jgi:hypothetical protein
MERGTSPRHISNLSNFGVPETAELRNVYRDLLGPSLARQANVESPHCLTDFGREARFVSKQQD